MFVRVPYSSKEEYNKKGLPHGSPFFMSNCKCKHWKLRGEQHRIDNVNHPIALIYIVSGNVGGIARTVHHDNIVFSVHNKGQ